MLNMEKIIEQLERMNKTLEGILDFMKKPESTINKVLEYGGAGVSILGILGIVDIIRNWIFGG
jgi:preprotein translocase subunit Sss1